MYYTYINHPYGDLALLLMSHLGTNQFEVPGPEVLDMEELSRPVKATFVVARSCGTLDMVLLG